MFFTIDTAYVRKVVKSYIEICSSNRIKTLFFLNLRQNMANVRRYRMMIDQIFLSMLTTIQASSTAKVVKGLKTTT